MVPKESKTCYGKAFFLWKGLKKASCSTERETLAVTSLHSETFLFPLFNLPIHLPNETIYQDMHHIYTGSSNENINPNLVSA